MKYLLAALLITTLAVAAPDPPSWVMDKLLERQSVMEAQIIRLADVPVPQGLVNPLGVPGTDGLDAGTIDVKANGKVEISLNLPTAGAQRRYLVEFCRFGLLPGCQALTKQNSNDNTIGEGQSELWMPQGGPRWVGYFIFSRTLNNTKNVHFVSGFRAATSVVPTGPAIELTGVIDTISGPVIKLKNLSLPIRVTDDTFIYGKERKLSDLEPGMSVEIKGVISGNEVYAERIKVNSKSDDDD